MRNLNRRSAQQGVFMIEALVAVLIFSLGVLAMVGTGTVSVTAQSDAQYRNQAARLAEDLAQEIYLNFDTTSTATMAATLSAFQYQQTGSNCVFSGSTPTSNTVLNDWLVKARGMPGASTTMQQIAIDPANFNAVTINICWRAGSDLAMRQHSYTAFVN